MVNADGMKGRGKGEESQARKEVGMELLTPGHKNDGANVMDLLLMVTIRYHMKVTHKTLLESVASTRNQSKRNREKN